MTSQIIRSLTLFLLAGLCEIGGGYLIWLWLKEQQSWGVGLLGGIILIIYGILAAQQTATFGRVYAAYGGIFIALSLLWGWVIDGQPPDRWDLVGAGMALLGAMILMYAPRN